MRRCLTLVKKFQYGKKEKAENSWIARIKQNKTKTKTIKNGAYMESESLQCGSRNLKGRHWERFKIAMKINGIGSQLGMIEKVDRQC